MKTRAGASSFGIPFPETPGRQWSVGVGADGLTEHFLVPERNPVQGPSANLADICWRQNLEAIWAMGPLFGSSGTPPGKPLAGQKRLWGAARIRKRIFLFFPRNLGVPFGVPCRAYPVLFGYRIRTHISKHRGEALGGASWLLWPSFRGRISKVFGKARRS